MNVSIFSSEACDESTYIAQRYQGFLSNRSKKARRLSTVYLLTILVFFVFTELVSFLGTFWIEQYFWIAATAVCAVAVISRLKDYYEYRKAISASVKSNAEIELQITETQIIAQTRHNHITREFRADWEAVRYVGVYNYCICFMVDRPQGPVWFDIRYADDILAAVKESGHENLITYNRK